MTLFCYDKTFEGLLTCVFDAYLHKSFPDALLEEGEPLPLFYDALFTIVTDSAKAGRIWKHLEGKLSTHALNQVATCWLADSVPQRDRLLFTYIRKAIDSPKSIEVNFGDPDVLDLARLYKQISYERMRILQFIRFQKAADGTYFAPFDPQHDVLPLAIDHFRNRYGDQKWLLYDTRRQYGYYYDLHQVSRITMPDDPTFLTTGRLEADKMADDEILFQKLWKTYFKAISIKERANPRKHRQDMPVRYWKYLTEKQ